MKRLVIVLPLLFIIPLYSHSQKKIKLVSDSNDSYVFHYKQDTFDIAMGYNTFFKCARANWPDDSVLNFTLKSYADKDLLKNKTVSIKDRGDYTFKFLPVVAELMNEGKVRIYDMSSKKYLDAIQIRKKRIQGAKYWVYIDTMAKRIIWKYCYKPIYFSED